MCIGCVLGACVAGVLYGSEALIAWRASARRAAAMQAVEDEARDAAETCPAPDARVTT